MPQKAPSDTTRERILKAAERIYAASGFHGMSLREVTLLAGVNLAAVNYHFGSKDKLIHAMADRRLTPINNERILRLKNLKDKHGKDPIPVTELVAALIDPMFKALRQSKGNRAIMVRLVAQMLIDDPHRFSHIHKVFYQNVIDFYHDELQRTFPGLASQQVYARFFCAFATVLGVRLMHDSMDWFLRTRSESKQFDLLEEEMTAFMIGGLSPVAR
ncbi:MAG: TetR family transcriptional regulator [Chthoniobacterales bacterium]